MRKMFLMAALSILLLVTGTGCEKETDLSESSRFELKTDYTYSAHTEDYTLTFTPKTLTVTDSSGVLTKPVTVDIETRTIQFDGLKIQSDVLFEENSIFILGEVLYKIMTKDIKTKTQTQDKTIQLSGEYLAPFCLTLDQNTVEPQKLEYHNTVVYFE